MATKKKRRDYNGKPSVTTIIGQTLGWSKDALIGWAYKLGKEGRSLRERDDAATLGQAVHHLVGLAFGAEGDETFADSVIEAARPNAERVIAWISERYEVVECERAIIGERFAGTLDYVLRSRDDGRLVIADLKTGKGVYDEVAIQLAAYDTLLLYSGAERCDRGLVIHAAAGESIEAYTVTGEQLAMGATAFFHLLDVYEARSKLRVKP